MMMVKWKRRNCINSWRFGGQFLVEKTGTFNMVGAQGWWVRCQNLKLKHQITIGQWLNERFTESGLLQPMMGEGPFYNVEFVLVFRWLI